MENLWDNVKLRRGYGLLINMHCLLLPKEFVPMTKVIQKLDTLVVVKMCNRAGLYKTMFMTCLKTGRIYFAYLIPPA